MSRGWHCDTAVLIGVDELAPWLAARPEPTVTILVDAAVEDGDVVAAVRRQAAWAGHASHQLTLSPSGGVDRVVALAGRLEPDSVVVAVGGGAVLDQAKLASAVRADPEVAARLASSQRGGLVLLPRSSAGRRAPLVAIPTTLGTGGELSSVACLSTGRGKRLVTGVHLRPDVAVLDPRATADLPQALVAEGVLEALARVVGPYVGDHRDQPTEDALAEAMAEQLVLLGHALCADRTGSAEDEVRDRARLEVAKLSGLSHAGWVFLGRTAHGNRCWYLGNELSTGLGLRKMTALAALLPPFWRAVHDGDSRLGSARRLGRIWDRLHATAPRALSPDPATGLADLIDLWEIDRRLTAEPDALARIAARTVRAWGAGLPMLEGLSVEDVRRLLVSAVHFPTAREAAVPAVPVGVAC